MKSKMNKIVVKISIVIFMISLLPIKTQAVSKNDTNMTFKRINIEDGLSQTSIEYL